MTTLERLVAIQHRHQMRDGEYRVNGLGIWLLDIADAFGLQHNYVKDRPKFWWYYRLLGKEYCT